MQAPASESQPHLDPVRWQELIESVGIPTVLVLIDSWMGTALKSSESVEDIWQETLWMAWRDRAQHDWRGMRAFRAWLLGIAKNRVRALAATLGRGGYRRAFPRIVDSDRDSPPVLEMPPGSTTPSRIAWHSERAAMVRAALTALPDKLERVVRLRLLEELPMREVAERLGIGYSTAKKQLVDGARLYRMHLEDAGLRSTTMRRDRQS